MTAFPKIRFEALSIRSSDSWELHLVQLSLLFGLTAAQWFSGRKNLILSKSAVNYFSFLTSSRFQSARPRVLMIFEQSGRGMNVLRLNITMKDAE